MKIFAKNKIIKDMVNEYMIALSLLSSEVFFSIFSIFNKKHTGDSMINIFIIMKCMILIYLVYWFIKKTLLNKKMTNKEYFFILLVVSFIFLYFVTSLRYGYIVNLYFSSIQKFIIVTCSALLAGFILNKRNDIIGLCVCIDKINKIIIVGLFLSVLYIIIGSGGNYTTTSFGGASYQFASYTAATSFSIEFYYLLYGDMYFNSNKINIKYFLFRCLLMLVSLGVLLFTGGRGGLIVVTVTILVSLLMMRNKKIINRCLSLFMIGLITLVIGFPLLINNETFTNGITRIVSYISFNGIQWEHTAGRGEIYSLALQLIEKNLFWGYGLGGIYYTELGSFPHNIFLEILLEGGIIYLTIWILILLYVIIKLRNVCKVDKTYSILWIFFSIGFVNLLFSTSYIIGVPLFWFPIAYAFFNKISNVKEVNKYGRYKYNSTHI